MSLHIRASGEQSRKTDASHHSMRRPTTTMTMSSAPSKTSPSYTRPTFQVSERETDSSPSRSGSSSFSGETDRSDQPVKTLRFKTPTVQFRPRQQDPTCKRKSPEPFVPRGPQAFESDNESPWNSSDGSSSTQLTSGTSDGDDGKKSSGSQKRRQAPARRTSVSHSGPSRRLAEYSDDSSREQARVLITQASARSHKSSSTTSDEQTVQHYRGYESDTTNLLSEIDVLRQEIKQLRDKESESARELDDVRGRLVNLQKEKEDMQEDRDDIQKEKDDMEKEHAAAIHQVYQECNQMMSKMGKESEAALKKLQEDFDQVTEAKKTVDDRLNEKEEQFQQQKTLNEELSAKYEDLSAKCAGLGAKCEDLGAKCAAFEKAKQEADYERQLILTKTISPEPGLKNALDLKNAQETSYMAQITRLNIALEARDLRVKNVEDDLAKSIAESTALTAERDQLKIDLQGQETLVTTLKADIANLENGKTELQKQLETVNNEKAELQTQLDAANNDKTSLASDAEAAKEAHGKEIEAKEASILSLEEDIKNLKAELESAKEEQASAQAKIDEATAKQTETQTEVDSLTSQIAQLKEEQNAASSEISRLKDECSKLVTDNASLRESSDVRSRAASETNQKLEVQIAELKEKLKARGAELQGKAAEAEKQLRKEKEAHAAADKKVATLQQRVTEQKALLAHKKKEKPKSKVKVVKII
ncbi:hypothetical protein S40288_01842 [Stachybotrys chartarum IBT 40288]|nr:hypothetical protein S40288_01842 [Stachybotrys chartarum IBT 40288]